MLYSTPLPPTSKTLVSVSKLHISWKHSSSQFKNFHIGPISFDIYTKGIYALVGSNGSGKSTLLKLLAGLLDEDLCNIQGTMDPQKSKLTEKGQITWSNTRGLLEESWTLTDMLIVGRYQFHRGIPNSIDKKIIADILHMLDLNHLAQERISTLSSGLQQKCWLALSLCQQPKILLLDEPTAHLDPLQSISFMKTLQKIIDDPSQKLEVVMMATHDLNLSLQYAQQIIGLRSGEMVLFAPADKIDVSQVLSCVYEQPKTISDNDSDNSLRARY